MVNDTAVIASEFNRCFESVFSLNDDHGLAEHKEPASCASSIVISGECVLSLLLPLDEKKSLGPNGIPNAFLKRYSSWVANIWKLCFRGRSRNVRCQTASGAHCFSVQIWEKKPSLKLQIHLINVYVRQTIRTYSEQALNFYFGRK